MDRFVVEMLNQICMLDWRQRVSQVQKYRQIKDHRQKRDSICCRFFTWLGGKLVIIGVRMLENYGKVSPLQNHRTLVPGGN